MGMDRSSVTNSHKMPPPPGRKPSSRPPQARPLPSRAHTATPTLNGRASPADSMISSRAPSRARSPTTSPQNGLKRKHRDYENEFLGEETNINVVVRCRGRNDRELKENSGVVVSTSGVKGNAVELCMGPSALSNKTYNFDRVFSPAADQGMIFDETVKPVLDQVLSGFNCTIFAYGQTGTGKTYTMSGDITDLLPLPDEAGIIPRVLHSLFGKLEDEAESTVKCSFIELYNEELRDLLAADDAVKLKIFDDASRKSHGATMVQGMEETHIKSASKGLELLRVGSHKRQVAATRCNDLSSRSHTVFTITTYVKRTGENGEDVVTSGKLNLVDLAGSENIQRSGAENKRAAEAGLINKSLLTLGRVINALVDKNAHIPYRESKLTRLLQDSLGGRTKTYIIATLSPAKSNLEETMSTLDYAFRAKNIRNKPQANQLLSKKTLIREFTAEIEKLKSELIATRQRNGVYLTTGTYEEMTVESESRRILTEEQRDKIETMEVNLRNKAQELFALTSNLNMLKKEFEGTRLALEGTESALERTEIILGATKRSLAEEEMLRKAHAATEDKLINLGNDMISKLGRSTADIEGLRAKHKRRSDLQALNRSKWTATQDKITGVASNVEDQLDQFHRTQDSLATALLGTVTGFVQDELSKLQASTAFLDEQSSAFDRSQAEVEEQTVQARDQTNNILEGIKSLRGDLKQQVGDGLDGLSEAAKRISQGVVVELENFHSQLHQSYSALGRDLKTTFDDLSRNLKLRETDALNLRRQLVDAGNALEAANFQHSQTLKTLVANEKSQAATERKQLLVQMTALVEGHGQEQDRRLDTIATSMERDIAGSNQLYQDQQALYNDGMKSWEENIGALQTGLQASREEVKQRIKSDWTTANEQTTSISETTRSVHRETTSIVDAQMSNMDVQLSSLDEILNRVRAQNSKHHDVHVQSLARLGNTVKESYLNIGEQMNDSTNSTRTFSSDLSSQITELRDTIGPVIGKLGEPLRNLKTDATAAQFVEYLPTGATPQKTSYEYTRQLPRTATHEHLLARFRGELVSESPKKSPQKRRPLEVPDLIDADDISLQRAISPSKAQVFNDTSVNLPTASLSPSKTLSSPILSRTEAPPPVDNTNDYTDRSLREVDVNVAIADNAVTVSRRLRKENEQNRPPPAKRHYSDAKPLSKSVGPEAKPPRKKIPAVAEGVENLPMSTSVGVGRQLRARRS